ncbi:MAG: hypothetical protein ACE5HE_09210 [Phycisphaerae bacterium]
MCGIHGCKRTRGVFLLVLASGLAIPACSVDISPVGGVENDNGSNGEPDASDDTIRVGFLNLSREDAVDVEFYFAEGALENIPDDLFVEQNRVRNDTLIQGQGIGTANLATIRPGEEDIVTLACGRELTIGTTGGTFRDAETHEERGKGTMIWLQQGAQFFCGAAIEFRYTSDGETFNTTYALEP